MKTSATLVLCGLVLSTFAHADFKYAAPPPPAPKAQVSSPVAAAPQIAVAKPDGKPDVPVAASAVKPVASTAEKALEPGRLVETIAPPEPAFMLKAGETLRTALARWCHDAGWTLVWSSDLDYPIGVTTYFPVGTTFKAAVRQTLAAYWNRPDALEGKLYTNNVIEITGSKR